MNVLWDESSQISEYSGYYIEFENELRERDAERARNLSKTIIFIHQKFFSLSIISCRKRKEVENLVLRILDCIDNDLCFCQNLQDSERRKFKAKRTYQTV